MKQGAKANLVLEVAAGCFFLLFVLLVGLMGLLAVAWIGTELLASAASETVTDRIIYTSRGFLTGFAILLIPSVVIGLAILGIRMLLVQPEPPPWEDESNEPFFGPVS